MDASASNLATVYAAERVELARFLCARCGDDSEAEDLLQDLWLKLDGLKTGPIGNPRAYLFRMANNLVLDRRRSRQRAMRRDRGWLAERGGGDPAPPELQADPALPADEDLAERQEANLLLEAIAELPPGARRALQLYRFEGHNQGQVAEIMGISRSGVEKHLALAMKLLRQTLTDCGAFAAATSHKQRNKSGAVMREEQGQ